MAPDQLHTQNLLLKDALKRALSALEVGEGLATLAGNSLTFAGKVVQYQQIQAILQLAARDIKRTISKDPACEPSNTPS